MEQVAELRGAERALFEQRAAALNYGRDVGALEVARERAARIEAPLEHRLDDRAHREAVAGRHEVESGAHQRSPDRGAVRDELRQRGGIEVLEPAPEGHVRVRGDLGLHPHQVLDRVRNGELMSLEEELPLQQGAIQCPFVEDWTACHEPGSTAIRGERHPGRNAAYRSRTNQTSAV